MASSDIDSYRSRIRSELDQLKVKLNDQETAARRASTSSPLKINVDSPPRSPRGSISGAASPRFGSSSPRRATLSGGPGTFLDLNFAAQQRPYTSPSRMSIVERRESVVAETPSSARRRKQAREENTSTAASDIAIYRLNNKVEDLQFRLRESERRRGEVEKELETARKETHALRSKATMQEAEMQADQAFLRKKVEDTASALHNAEETTRDWKTSYERLDSSKKDVDAKLQMTLRELEETKRQLALTRKELDEMTSTKDSLNKVITDLKHRVSKKEREASRMHEDNVALHEKIKATEHKWYQKHEDDRRRYDGALRSLEAELADSRVHVQSLGRQLEEERYKVAEGERRVVSLQQEAERAKIDHRKEISKMDKYASAKINRKLEKVVKKKDEDLNLLRKEMEAQRMAFLEEHRVLQDLIERMRESQKARIGRTINVERDDEGDLIARCRRCGRKFNVNKNFSNECGTHPGRLVGREYTCCGTKYIPGQAEMFCAWSNHVG